MYKIIPLILALLVSACVSVDLQPKHVPAKGFTFDPPAAPYKAIGSDQLAQAWQNSSNGNSISVFSDCNDKSDPSLTALQRDVLSILEEQVNESQTTQQLNQREARVNVSSGKLDGVTVKMKVISFKKNNCSYSLNYVGTPKSFSSDTAVFKKFVSGFSVP